MGAGFTKTSWHQLYVGLVGERVDEFETVVNYYLQISTPTYCLANYPLNEDNNEGNSEREEGEEV